MEQKTILDEITAEAGTVETTSKKKTKETDLLVIDSEPDVEIIREGVYVHTFKTPFEDCGEIYEKIEFEFVALTGADMISIENEMKLLGEFGEIAEVSKTYQCRIAVRAAAKGENKTIISAEALQSLPMKDFFKITNAVRDFLLITGG